VVFGPRQTGKSTLARSFARRHFAENTIEINFFRDTRDKTNSARYGRIFEESQDPAVILRNIGVLKKRTVDPERDILILDEIQDCKPAYEALKNFKDDYPGFPIIASGSYLGLFLETESEVRHPVGATQELHLGPLSFREFLANFNAPLFSVYLEITLTDTSIDPVVHRELLEALNTYLFTGGMPEPLTLFLSSYDTQLYKAIERTRGKQSDLMLQYARDIDRYGKTSDVKKLRKIFEALPLYLERFHEESVDRLRFGDITERATYRDFKSSFDYLKYNGLVIETRVVNSPQFPLHIQHRENETNQFKAFLFDVGLLNCALDCPYQQLFNKEMGHYKGYLVENFVAQQLKKYSRQPHLFTFKKSAREQAAEIEFLVTIAGTVIPIEVKSSTRSSRSKSLRSYVDQFSPERAYKCSLQMIARGDRYQTIPLYLIEKIFDAVRA
jgi:predicted AAA+ superfamily ATPase